MKHRLTLVWSQIKTSLSSRMPTPESLGQNRWLSWLGPALYRKHLWHFSRRGLALGVAIGVFFGFLIPIAQIPFSAAAAVVLRANLPVAMVSTLVTNPVTFAPVYYAAYHTGVWVLGQADGNPIEDPHAASPAEGDVAAGTTEGGSALSRFWNYVTGVGKPLVLGLALFAVGAGLMTYAVINWVWIALARRRHRQRRTSRARAAVPPHQPPASGS